MSKREEAAGRRFLAHKRWIDAHALATTPEKMIQYIMNDQAFHALPLRFSASWALTDRYYLVLMTHHRDYYDMMPRWFDYVAA